MDPWGEHYLRKLPIEVITGRENRYEGHDRNSLFFLDFESQNLKSGLKKKKKNTYEKT